MPADLTGHLALVTGSSKGIGQATALALARAGADVVIHYHQNRPGAEATNAGIAKIGRKTMVVQADVSKAADVQALHEKVAREIGSPDILVNNAGLAKRKELDQIEEADWDEVIDVNLKSVFLMTRAFLPAMRQKRWGRIVNISSGAAHAAGAVGVHYNAAKAGIEGLTRGYAARLAAEGITVNAVAPTFIDTGGGRDNAARAKMVPIGRTGRPEEIAEAVLLCAGTEYITGQVIVLNGGLYFR
jgi:3-oxoacyl-[acyl-carrier protein] reductase